MLYGIVDIGSNTIRYQVYEDRKGKLKSVITSKKTVGLISYKENGKLNDEGIERLLGVLKTFKKNLSFIKTDYDIYFGTASLRNITNKDEVLKIVKEKLDIDIWVLTSMEEADFSFNAVKSQGLSHHSGVIFDVGGGSSEIIPFEHDVAMEKTSLAIGSLTAYYDYVSLMFPSKEEIDKIRKTTLKLIKKSSLKKEDYHYMYGVGGTIRGISKVLNHLNLKNSQSKTIPVKLLTTLEEELSQNTKEDYAKVLQVKSERVHTLVPGLVIIKTIAEYYNIKEIIISSKTIREGILQSVINKDKKLLL